METDNNIYVPQWHVKNFLYFLRGHILEGDISQNQLLAAINTYLLELKEEKPELKDMA